MKNIYLTIESCDDGSAFIAILKISESRQVRGRLYNPPTEGERVQVFESLQWIRDEGNGAEHATHVKRVERYGERLYGSLPGNVREILGGYFRGQEDFGMRINLANAGHLSLAPWEVLRHPDSHEFIVQKRSPSVAITRYLPTISSWHTAPLEEILRILVVLPECSELDRLDKEGEWDGLNRALHGSRQIDPLLLKSPTTWERVRESLRTNRCHVLHFGGHAVNASEGRGTLYLEGNDGTPDPVDCGALADALGDYSSLYLVVINACESGRLTGRAFDGLATSLCKRGFPAVAAMQFKLTDGFAVSFSACFYGSLSNGNSVDVAMHQARRELRRAQAREDFQWLTPVLYMSGEGQDTDQLRADRESSDDVKTCCCDRNTQWVAAGDAIPSRSILQRSEGRKVRHRPLVLVTHGGLRAEHGAFLKRIQRILLPTLHWEQVRRCKVPRLSPGSDPASVARQIRRCLAEKLGGDEAEVQDTICNMGEQALLIDIQCSCDDWLDSNKSLREEVYSFLAGLERLPDEKLLVCVLSVRHSLSSGENRDQPAPKNAVFQQLKRLLLWVLALAHQARKYEEYTKAMIADLGIPAAQNASADGRVDWRVLPELGLVSGAEVRIWYDTYCPKSLSYHQLAAEVFPSKRDKIMKYSNPTSSLVDGDRYIEKQNIDMQTCILRLERVLKEAYKQKGDESR